MSVNVRDILFAIDSLSEDVEASHPEISAALDEAGVLLMASDEKIAAAVDDVASTLRTLLPGLDEETSAVVAADLVQKYGTDNSVKEALIPTFRNKNRMRKGPDPASSGMYAPGRPDWWTVT